eukprot:jgi/Botrbrau1/5927/Bobra.0366s0101.1
MNFKLKPIAIICKRRAVRRCQPKATQGASGPPPLIKQMLDLIEAYVSPDFNSTVLESHIANQLVILLMPLYPQEAARAQYAIRCRVERAIVSSAETCTAEALNAFLQEVKRLHPSQISSELIPRLTEIQIRKGLSSLRV